MHDTLRFVFKLNETNKMTWDRLGLNWDVQEWCCFNDKLNEMNLECRIVYTTLYF